MAAAAALSGTPGNTAPDPAARRGPRPGQAAAAPVDFDREVRPILSENCFACHGFDANKRQAGLRLDISEGAFKPAASGAVPIIPKKPDSGTLFRRVATRTMPPHTSGKRLTDIQIETLRRWISEGAVYRQHWAFVAPVRPSIPAVKNRVWPRNPIDAFVLARLERKGLRPAREADRYTLIRRLSYDLTGLPPTISEVDAFARDERPDAYERLVERLLASPHYGERMAVKWLDLARYADTHGYHIDSHRDMWRWRDWVIDALNRNMPFDQFTVEQLAGDLLPNAGLSQKLATGFNRNHPINYEGGAIPEEYQTAYVVDRINTTATTWMGLTMACAQCHDHKYDPLTQKDFYQFYAFFNNVPEKGLDGQTGNAVPYIKAPTPEQETQLAAFSRTMGEVETALKARAAAAGGAVSDWMRRAAPAPEAALDLPEGVVAHYGLDERSGTETREAASTRPAGRLVGTAQWVPGRYGAALDFDGKSHVDLGAAVDFDRSDPFSFGAWVKPRGNEGMSVLSRMEDQPALRGWDLYLGEGKVFVHLIHQWEQNALRVNTKTALEPDRWSHVFATYDGSGKSKGVRVYVNGRPVDTESTHDTLTGSIRTEAPLRIGVRSSTAPFKGVVDEVRIYARALEPTEVERLALADPVRQALAIPAEQRTTQQREEIASYYLTTQDETYRRLAADLASWRQKHADVERAIPTSMVMEEMPKARDTHILVRGQYDKPGEKVTPGVPGTLPPLPGDAAPNRLALAKWLVNPNHPLTARVAVNRYWHMLFATGLVKTSENFGIQGEAPSHPELLDWLATEFVRTGWDVKGMLRLLVTSATYRQSSHTSPALLAMDPENRLLARATRSRLPAELIRDQALAQSGLLVRSIGGPSVRPYQPPGLWEEIAFGGTFSAQTYQQDHGDALYRRSLYTFWKRTCPPPSLQTFDAPEREFCMVRRSVTNTPLQALILMNDVTYVEAARKFAERMMKEGGASQRSRLTFALRTALARPPREAEITTLTALYNQQAEVYRKDRAAAAKLLAAGESNRDDKLDAAELAAWTCVANAIMNLDEAITRG